MKTVLVFGAFDPLHAGHTHFLGEARAHGDRLVVALATDDAIRKLKGHEPRTPFTERSAALMLLSGIDEIVPSDAAGDFSPVTSVRPDVIALGYDQAALHGALALWMTTHDAVPIVTLGACQPEKYKSSLLN